MPVDTSEDAVIPPELTDPFGVGIKEDYTLAESRVASDFVPLSAKSFPRASLIDHGRDTKITIVSPLLVASDATWAGGLCPGGCIQPCHCYSRPDTKSFVVLKGPGVIKTEEAVLYSPSHLGHPYSRSLIFSTLLQFGKKRLPRLSASRRTLSHVTLARVTKPVTYLTSIGELAWVFRCYFYTLLILRRFGWEATNVSLENLAIAPRKPEMIGKGIITHFDDQNRDPSWPLRPRFIYTMPCKTLLTDDLPDPTRLVGLESILLCLIWIATTRSGPLDKRRTDFSYCFSETEIGRWNRRDGCNDVSGQYQDSQKLKVMQSEDLFAVKVLCNMHPYFQIYNINAFLRGLRSIIYDPKWQSARDLISGVFVGDCIAKRSSFKKLARCLMRAVKGDEEDAYRALETFFPPPTDHCATIERHKNEAPSKECQQAKEGRGKALEKLE